MRRHLMTALAISLCYASITAAEPMPGQIVVDPEHPQWLMRHGGEHVYICGPGDPEGFLYRGSRLADGTRDGDQSAIIEKLIKHGGNSLYMQIVRSHRGDGEPDHNPFVDSDPKKGVDPGILDQWESWFSRMDENNILIYLFLYDDNARVWKTGDTVGTDERRFIETIVNRFKHHKNLIWIVAEESEEAYSAERVQAIARVIHETDEFGHLIGDHHHTGTTFKAWREDGHLNHFAMQLAAEGDLAHAGAVEAFEKAAGRYQIIYSENTQGEPTAQYAWRCAMGGLMPMIFEMDVATTPVVELQRCRYLQRFFEATNFYRLTPHDELAQGGTKWLLAKPGMSYIAYAERLDGPMGVEAVRPGDYRLAWLDCATGEQFAETRRLSGGDQTFNRPRSIGPWCAVRITRE